MIKEQLICELLDTRGRAACFQNITQSLREAGYIGPPFLLFVCGKNSVMFLLVKCFLADVFRLVCAEKEGRPIKVGYF